MFASNWYYNLAKPLLNPPDWIFMPVWSVLYFMIFTSLFIYISKSANNKTLGYIYFLIQLLLNLLWAPSFFYLQDILLSLIIIIGLDIAVVFTMFHFYKISKISSLLLIPYFIWILFATYLDIGYWILNFK